MMTVNTTDQLWSSPHLIIDVGPEIKAVCPQELKMYSKEFIWNNGNDGFREAMGCYILSLDWSDPVAVSLSDTDS